MDINSLTYMNVCACSSTMNGVYSACLMERVECALYDGLYDDDSVYNADSRRSECCVGVSDDDDDGDEDSSVSNNACSLSSSSCSSLLVVPFLFACVRCVCASRARSHSHTALSFHLIVMLASLTLYPFNTTYTSCDSEPRIIAMCSSRSSAAFINTASSACM